jgi:predicted RNase H-like nuclease (RuvC/YqgF family)
MGQKELAGVIDQLRDELVIAKARIAQLERQLHEEERADLMVERTEIEQLREEIADLKLKLEKSGQLAELLWEVRKS